MNYDTIVLKSKKIIEHVTNELCDILANTPYQLEHRIKSKEHIYRKFQKKNLKKITDVEDIIGFRILVENEEMCHRVYSILTNYYHPYKISNYFSNPKATGFKAYILKLDKYDINSEIQIMTSNMKEITERTHLIHENIKYH